MQKSSSITTTHILNTIEEKLYITKFCPSIETHIKTNPDLCAICRGKECTKFCPSNVFHWSKINNKLLVGYENCLECGACTIGCPYEAIEYNHPEVGCGLI